MASAHQLLTGGRFNPNLLESGQTISLRGTTEAPLRPPPQPEPWYKTDKFYKIVKAFHDTYAREPTSEMDIAKTVHTQYINEINRQLKNDQNSIRLEFTGSSYEGVKVSKGDDHDLEFDVMVIMDAGREKFQVMPIPGSPSFVELKQIEILPVVRIVTEAFVNFNNDRDGNYVSASTTAQKFHGILQKYINRSTLMNGKVKLIYHGPATQMDVYRSNWDLTHNTNKFYSVDMVPTYEVGPNKELYVAKPKPGEATASAWRRSFSLAEKEKFKQMDADKGCRKQVLRILKVIRNREAGLAPLTSFHLKTALFKEIEARTSEYSWMFDRLGERLWDLMGRIQDELTTGVMSHYFISNVNLLDGWSQSSKINIRDRFKHLRESETQFTNILK